MAKTAKKTKVKPTFMKGKKPLKIGLHDVIRALKVIEEHGQMDRFTKAAKKKKARMLVEPDTVNFVKDFMAKNDMHEHPVGRHIVNPVVVAAAASGPAPGGTPKDKFECDFRKD